MPMQPRRRIDGRLRVAASRKRRLMGVLRNARATARGARVGSKSCASASDEPSVPGISISQNTRNAGGAGGTSASTAASRNSVECDGGRGRGGARARSARTGAGRAWRSGVKSANGTKAAIGPRKPPESKQRRKRGAAIAALEGTDLFLNGDWNAIEKFATCRLPLYSVAWSTLKGYESSWKHWISFQYFARLPIFVETNTPSKRRLTSKYLMAFVALLAYGSRFRASTIKGCLMAIRFFFHLAHLGVHVP